MIQPIFLDEFILEAIKFVQSIEICDNEIAQQTMRPLTTYLHFERTKQFWQDFTQNLRTSGKCDAHFYTQEDPQFQPFHGSRAQLIVKAISTGN